MGHEHGRSHGTAPSGAVNLTKYAWLSIAAALATIALKTGAWWITGSVGLLSDAAESVVNLVAAVIALVALTVAARPPDAEHHYGHGKAEYFSAAIEGLMIFVAAAVILVTAVQRLLNPVELESLGVGLAISLVATGINGSVGLLLIRVGREHRSATLTADGKRYLDWVLEDRAGQGVASVRPIRNEIKARVLGLLGELGVAPVELSR